MRGGFDMGMDRRHLLLLLRVRLETGGQFFDVSTLALMSASDELSPARPARHGLQLIAAGAVAPSRRSRGWSTINRASLLMGCARTGSR